MKRTRAGTSYGDEQAGGGSKEEDFMEEEEEEEYKPPPSSSSICTQIKANAAALELPASTQLHVLDAAGAITLRACLQDLLTKHPTLAADVKAFTDSRQGDIEASLREHQQLSLTQLRALTEHTDGISKSRREALTHLATSVRDRVLKTSKHNLAASLDDIFTFMSVFRRSVPREVDLRYDTTIGASRAVELLLMPVWGRLLSAAESAMPPKKMKQHVERAVACDVNGRLPLEGKLAEHQLQQLVRAVAAEHNRDQLLKKFHAAASSLGHSYRLCRRLDEPAPPAGVQALADQVLRVVDSGRSGDRWSQERPTAKAALLQHMCRWDELVTLASSEHVSADWVLREVMLPPKVFSNPQPGEALAVRRPQVCIGRAQQELQFGLLPQAIQQLRLLMGAGMMEALQEAWDEADHEATAHIVEAHVNDYDGKVIDYSLGGRIGGWLECAKLACSRLDTSGSGHSLYGPPDTTMFKSLCSTLRDAAKESFDSEDEQKAMRSIVSVRHCDFDGRWYGSVWPAVFAAVDGVLDHPFDLIAMGRCHSHY